MEFGKWNYRELAHKPKEIIDEFWKYYEQFARRAESDGALNKDQGNVFILDWEGFSLTNYASPQGNHYKSPKETTFYIIPFVPSTSAFFENVYAFAPLQSSHEVRIPY